MAHRRSARAAAQAKAPDSAVCRVIHHWLAGDGDILLSSPQQGATILLDQQDHQVVHIAAGTHKLVVYAVDPGIVLDQISVVERILKKNNFAGVLIPDHAPQMACAAPWHAGMAYALGYMRAALNALEQ